MPYCSRRDDQLGAAILRHHHAASAENHVCKKKELLTLRYDLAIETLQSAHTLSNRAYCGAYSAHRSFALRVGKYKRNFLIVFGSARLLRGAEMRCHSCTLYRSDRATIEYVRHSFRI